MRTVQGSNQEKQLADFAGRYRLRVRRDGCGDPVILGRKTALDMPDRLEYRNHIYDTGDGRLAVCLMLRTKTRWTYAKKKLRAAGFVIHQDGDTEGTASFDPANQTQARLAIRITGAKAKRRSSPAQLAGLRKPLASGAALAPGQTQTEAA